MKKHEDYLALLQEPTISHFRGEVSKDIFFDDDAYEAMPERITFQFTRWKSAGEYKEGRQRTAYGELQSYLFFFKSCRM